MVEWQWVDWSAFRSVAATTPWLLSPWSVLQAAQLPADLHHASAAPGHVTDRRA